MHRQIQALRRAHPLRVRRASGQAVPPPTASNILKPAIAFGAGIALTAAAFQYTAGPPQVLAEEPRADQKKGAPRRRPFATDFKDAIAELHETFPAEQVSIDEDDLKLHGVSPNTHHPPANPAVVFYPESTEDVQKAVKIAVKYRMPCTPVTGSTSLESHCSSPYGGLCIDLSRMDAILEIHEKDGDLVCQAGARWMDINEELKDRGIPLFFPLDPGPGAAVGGMMGTSCSGTNAMRYGTAKAEWFLNATVVLPNGEVIKTRSRARKSSAGFDLTKLFIGAEGTLGIVTECTIRLTPLLPTRVAICNFPTVREAVDCVIDVMNKGVPLQCVEMLDAISVHAVNKSGLCPLKLEEQPSIWFKMQGDPEATELAVRQIEKVLAKHQGGKLLFGKDQEESDGIWHARKTIAWSIQALKPNHKHYITDVCVPLSALPDMVYDTLADFEKHGLYGTTLGHAGDGNFHASILFKDDSEFPQVDAAAHRMVDRAIAMGGTCTGEHGVGTFKRGYLKKELGEGTVAVMQSIKDLMDPHGIMNPGKLYPDIETDA